MRSRVAAVGLGLALIVVSVLSWRQNESCQREEQGLLLGRSLYNVDLMVRLLGGQNGSEDPKMKELMEMNLQFAVRDAVDAIGHGAELGPHGAVTFIDSVAKAEQ